MALCLFAQRKDVPIWYYKGKCKELQEENEVFSAFFMDFYIFDGKTKKSCKPDHASRKHDGHKETCGLCMYLYAVKISKITYHGVQLLRSFEKVCKKTWKNALLFCDD